MLFTPTYDFTHVAERIVMPEEQKPLKSAAPVTAAAAKQATARVPNHYTGYSVREFLEWEKAHQVKRTNELHLKNQNRHSNALGC